MEGQRTLQHGCAGRLQSRRVLQGGQHLHQAIVRSLADLRPRVCGKAQQQREWARS